MNKSINLIIRKSKGLFRSNFIKKFHKSSNMSIIINSIPKSGTHLADQFIVGLNEINDFDYFISQQPTYPHILRKEEKILKMCKKIKNGELVRAHMHYSKMIEEFLMKNNILMIFVFRDPRDVVISEANYLYDMNTLHSAHKFFKNIPSEEERIKLSIKGIDSNRIDFKNCYGRFEPFLGWKNLALSNVLPVSFEEMRNNEKDVQSKIYYFLKKNNFFENQISYDKFIELTQKNIKSSNSHTFRTGKVNNWKRKFNDELSDLYNQYEKGITEKMGYLK